MEISPNLSPRSRPSEVMSGGSLHVGHRRMRPPRDADADLDGTTAEIAASGGDECGAIRGGFRRSSLWLFLV